MSRVEKYLLYGLENPTQKLLQRIENALGPQRNGAKPPDSQLPQTPENSISPISRFSSFLINNFWEESILSFITSPDPEKSSYIKDLELLMFLYKSRGSYIDLSTNKIVLSQKSLEIAQNFFKDSEPNIAENVPDFLKNPKYQSLSFVISSFSSFGKPNVSWLADAKKESPEKHEKFLSVLLAFEETLEDIFQNRQFSYTNSGGAQVCFNVFDKLVEDLREDASSPYINAIFSGINKRISILLFHHLSKYIHLTGSFNEFFGIAGVAEAVFALRRLTLLRMLSGQIENKLRRSNSRLEFFINPYSNFDTQILSPNSASLFALSKGKIPFDLSSISDIDILNLSCFFALDEYIRNYNQDDCFAVKKPNIPYKIEKDEADWPELFTHERPKVIGFEGVPLPIQIETNYHELEENGCSFKFPTATNVFGFDNNGIANFLYTQVKRFTRKKKK